MDISSIIKSVFSLVQPKWTKIGGGQYHETFEPTYMTLPREEGYSAEAI
jgi:hypothetical protein